MDGRRSGCARVLDPGGRLETQIGRSLEHQGGGEILRREAGVGVAEQDLINIRRRNAGIIKHGGGRTRRTTFTEIIFTTPEDATNPPLLSPPQSTPLTPH